MNKIFLKATLLLGFCSSFVILLVALVFVNLYLASDLSGNLRLPNFKPALVTSAEIQRKPYVYLDSQLDGKEDILGIKVLTADARPIKLRNYLAHYRSPLLDYSDFIFEISQQYGLDYRLLVAIAQQESNLCKKIPPNTFNCWGWGIHSRGTLGFSSYEDAIRAVASGLKREYIDEGYTTPEEIMKKYTPLSDGSWAAGVSQFMEEIESGF